jgi:hypothetical protein
MGQEEGTQRLRAPVLEEVARWSEDHKRGLHAFDLTGSGAVPRKLGLSAARAPRARQALVPTAAPGPVQYGSSSILTLDHGPDTTLAESSCSFGA